MNYAEARGRIRDGDLIAVRSNHGGLAALIRAVTKSPYTHTGVAIWLDCWQTGEHGLYIAEMDGIKAVLTPLSQRADVDFDVFDCPVDRGAACAELLAALRHPISYDYLDLLRIGARKLWGWALPRRDRGGLVCSALSARIYRNARWMPGYELPSLPAPSDLVAAIGYEPFLVVRP
ncbi:hypothetical protein DLREEDagrD3_28800 [Denitratisoma sp. agr-D3]